ncbi:hypothetical protein KEM55_005798 [Ascosphaera atra]|nr:hypothetical protein KEM55_005798 [Ascosphaera atra]
MPDQLSTPLSEVKPHYTSSQGEQKTTQTIINTLHLEKHIEGGYFVETDRNPLQIPNPFPSSTHTKTDESNSNNLRSASTTIFYYLTPSSPQGAFHTNAGRTIHTLHHGRGRYVIIHADEATGGKKARVEVFTVGKNIAAGEKLQWIVEGGKYKASYLLPDEEGSDDTEGLLISETVVPGFEYCDHGFLDAETLQGLVEPDQARELSWLVRKHE